jgi:hypothetical protein
VTNQRVLSLLIELILSAHTDASAFSTLDLKLLFWCLFGIIFQFVSFQYISIMEIRYSLYRRLGGPQVQCERVRKISPPPGFHPRTVRPVAIRYTTYTFPAHKSVYRASVNASSCTVQTVTVRDSLHTAAFVTESDQMALRYEMPRLHVAALATRSAGQRLSTLSQTTLKPLDSRLLMPSTDAAGNSYEILFASPPSSILGLTWFRLSVSLVLSSFSFRQMNV